MAIDSYLKLQSLCSFYANRDDLAVAVTNFSPAAIDTPIQMAIALAENRVDRDINARGGVKYAQTVNSSLTTTASTETLTLPTDFRSQEMLAISASGLYTVLTFKNPKDLFTLYPSTTLTGAPEAFTVIGTGTAYLRPVPDVAYATRLIYKAALTPLSSTVTSNWLLVNGLQVYLSASMLELAMMMKNDERIQFWKGYYDQAMNDFMGDDRQTRWAGIDATPRPVGQIA